VRAASKPGKAARKQRRGITARTIRFPEPLRHRIAADAERCGRSFEAHVLALLRRHFGESVDIVPPPDSLLGLAFRTAEGISDEDWSGVTRRLGEEGRG
jgi:hypothetical protein